MAQAESDVPMLCCRCGARVDEMVGTVPPGGTATNKPCGHKAGITMGDGPETAVTDTTNYAPFRVPPNERAPYLLDEVIEHGDENGALANATADELRDALAIAVERIRELVRRWPGGIVKPESRPSRLPPLDQLCPYCAAWPTVPCNDAVRRYLLGYIHAGDREFDALYALTLVLDGLREFATTGGSNGTS